MLIYAISAPLIGQHKMSSNCTSKGFTTNWLRNESADALCSAPYELQKEIAKPTYEWLGSFGYLCTRSARLQLNLQGTQG